MHSYGMPRFTTASVKQSKRKRGHHSEGVAPGEPLQKRANVGQTVHDRPRIRVGWALMEDLSQGAGKAKLHAMFRKYDRSLSTCLPNVSTPALRGIITTAPNSGQFKDSELFTRTVATKPQFKQESILRFTPNDFALVPDVALKSEQSRQRQGQPHLIQNHKLSDDYFNGISVTPVTALDSRPSALPLEPTLGDTNVSGSREKLKCWEHGCNGRQFSGVFNLLRHQRAMGGIVTKTRCPHCGMYFTSAEARNDHMYESKCRNMPNVTTPHARGSSLTDDDTRKRREKNVGKSDSEPRSKPDPKKMRTWTDRSGDFKVEAQFIGIADSKIHLHKVNGVKIAVPVFRMSAEDTEYVEKGDWLAWQRWSVAFETP